MFKKETFEEENEHWPVLGKAHFIVAELWFRVSQLQMLVCQTEHETFSHSLPTIGPSSKNVF